MVELHGWVTIRDTPYDVDEDRTDTVAARIQDHMSRIQSSSLVLGMRVLNANYMMWIAGCMNHRTSELDQVLDLMRFIASVGPGSYGLLYIWDDEATENEFRVYRLARGILTEHSDTLLSPCIPTIEG